MDREASMRGESETDIWVKGCQIIHQTSYSYCIYQLKIFLCYRQSTRDMDMNESLLFWDLLVQCEKQRKERGWRTLC